MVSRSSSSYHPLDDIVELNDLSGQPDISRISVVSTNGTKNGTTSILIPDNKSSSGGGNNSIKNNRGKNSMILSRSSDQKECCHNCLIRVCCCCYSETGEKTQWTNFHFVMCIGVVGFVIFWIVLLARMYLPTKYRFWM